MNRASRLAGAALLPAALSACPDSGSEDIQPVAKVRVTPTSGLVTGEGGTTATFHVELTTQPTAPVVVQLHSSRPDEGTASTTELTFTPADWTQPRLVTLTGVDDDELDGDAIYLITLEPARSADLRYQGADVPDVTVTNTDDDTPGFRLVAIDDPTMPEGGEVRMMVSLASRPSSEVRVVLDVSDASDIQLSRTDLSFPARNWDQPQEITVRAVADFIADGNHTPSVTARGVAGDLDYNGLASAPLTVATVDDDVAGIVHDAQPMILPEVFRQIRFRVSITSAPTAFVTVPIHSDSVQAVQISPSRIEFHPGIVSQSLTVDVAVLEDRIDQGEDRLVKILFGPAESSDPFYSGLTAAPLELIIQDDDVARMDVFRNFQDNQTCEASVPSCCRELTLSLNSEPTADVAVTISVSDETEATVSPRSLTIDPASSRGSFPVTVCGLDDSDADGSQPYTVVFRSASADPFYNDRSRNVLDFINNDND